MTQDKHPFVVSIALKPNESPAERLSEVIAGLGLRNLRWAVSDVDATGRVGDLFTNQTNQKKTLALTTEQLLELLREAGQVFELRVDCLEGDGSLFSRALISDGRYLDWMGSGNPSDMETLGEYTIQDCELFCWPDASQ